MENSFPEPVDLFHVLTSPLLVTLALIVHLFCNTLNIEQRPRRSVTWYGVMLAIGVTTGPLPPVAGLGCKTEVRTGGTLKQIKSAAQCLNVGYSTTGVKFIVNNTDALGVGALAGPPPIGFSFALFIGGLAAPALGLAFWLEAGGGTWFTLLT